MSDLMRSFVAGQLKYARDITYFLAPYINSYKRFQAGTFAPTKTVWSRDNRTAGFRLCGEDSKAIRIECRIGGADLNPYLAFAALIAAGLAGVDEKLELEPPFAGDAYAGKLLPEVPKTLREATGCLLDSKLPARGARRGCRRALRAHGALGAVRVRPPHHRLGADARVRAVLRAGHGRNRLHLPDRRHELSTGARRQPRGRSRRPSMPRGRRGASGRTCPSGSALH